MSLFAANLTTIFTEVPFLERFKKAKKAGFKYVECQFPYEVPIEFIQTELRENELSLVLINFPAGVWENGERGLAIYSDRIEEFRESVTKGIEYASALGVSKLHCLAGVLHKGMDYYQARKTYMENLKFAAEQMVPYHLTLLIEPINPFDMPGYFLNDIKEAVEIIEEIGMSNIKLQFDFYHIQRMQGNLLSNFSQYLEVIEHIQFADVPGRHQPFTGEINYQNVWHEILRQEYKGYIGLEYTPLGKSEDSFTWMNAIEGGSWK